MTLRRKFRSSKRDALPDEPFWIDASGSTLPQLMENTGRSTGVELARLVSTRNREIDRSDAAIVVERAITRVTEKLRRNSVPVSATRIFREAVLRAFDNAIAESRMSHAAR